MTRRCSKRDWHRSTQLIFVNSGRLSSIPSSKGKKWLRILWLSRSPWQSQAKKERDRWGNLCPGQCTDSSAQAKELKLQVINWRRGSLRLWSPSRWSQAKQFALPIDPDLQECLSLAVRFPEWLNGYRKHVLAFWEAQANRLLPETEKILSQVEDRRLRRLLRGQDDHCPLQMGSCFHIALWKELMAKANSIDTDLVDQMLHGMSIVGDIARSKRWPTIQGTEDLSLDNLRSRAWEFSAKVNRNVARSEVTQHTEKVWEATMEDVAEKVTVGPFYSHQEVSDFVGCNGWIPTQRFEVVQKNKVRGVDSATVNGVNRATKITEKLELPSTDGNVAALRWLRTHCKVKLTGWVLDERKAYRQIAVRPDHRKWSVVSLRDPKDGKQAFFVMIGHSFWAGISGL